MSKFKNLIPIFFIILQCLTISQGDDSTHKPQNISENILLSDKQRFMNALFSKAQILGNYACDKTFTDLNSRAKCYVAVDLVKDGCLAFFNSTTSQVD